MATATKLYRVLVKDSEGEFVDSHDMPKACATAALRMRNEWLKRQPVQDRSFRVVPA